MIHVLAFITTKPGMRAAVLAEEGCIAYGPAIDAAGIGAIQTAIGPDSFVVVEQWSSAATLAAHGAAPHMKAYGAKVRDMVASRVIHVLSPAA